MIASLRQNQQVADGNFLDPYAYLVPDTGNDDGDVTHEANKHKDHIGDKKAVVAYLVHSENFDEES